jgi:hypothetical protein
MTLREFRTYVAAISERRLNEERGRINRVKIICKVVSQAASVLGDTTELTKAVDEIGEPDEGKVVPAKPEPEIGSYERIMARFGGGRPMRG